MNPPTSPPLALLRGAATVLPRPVVAHLAAAVLRGLRQSHPRLLDNLARLEPAVVHIAPTDLPYRFALALGTVPVTLDIVARDAPRADATVMAPIATLVELLEGRIDSDTLFFRRDLRIEGNTEVVVGLRNVMDRDELSVAAILDALAGPLGPPARVAARRLDRLLEAFGERVAAMHRTLHPPATESQDVAAELERCHAEIRSASARIAKLEARQQRRDEKAA